MTDPVTTFMRLLLLAVTALNLWSLVRNIRAQNKYDLSRTLNECRRDKEGKICFAEWMLIHHRNERVEHTGLLRMYKRWRDERDLPITTRLVNDGMLLDMMLSSVDNTEDTPT